MMAFLCYGPICDPTVSEGFSAQPLPAGAVKPVILGEGVRHSQCSWRDQLLSHLGCTPATAALLTRALQCSQCSVQGEVLLAAHINIYMPLPLPKSHTAETLPLIGKVGRIECGTWAQSSFL